MDINTLYCVKQSPFLCAKIKKQPFFGVFLIKTAVFYYKVFCILLGFGVFCY